MLKFRMICEDLIAFFLLFRFPKECISNDFKRSIDYFFILSQFDGANWFKHLSTKGYKCVAPKQYLVVSLEIMKIPNYQWKSLVLHVI